MRTRTYYVLLIYVSSLLALGLVLLNPLFVFLAVPFLWIIIASEIINYRPLEVERDVPEGRFVEGDEISIGYSLYGEGYYEIEDELFDMRGFISGEEERKMIFRADRFDVVRLRNLHVLSEDFAGMKFDEKRIQFNRDLKIYPKIEYVRKFSIKPRKTRSLLGDYPSRRRGRGHEFSEIREYEPGDSMRWVNWKSTARRDKLMVNQYESERTGDAVILLDVRRFYKGSEEYEKLLLHSVRAAATIATYLTRTKNRVGLVLLGETVDWLYPTYGKRALYLIFEKLLATRSEKISKVPFEYGKFIVSRFFPPNSFIIIISPLLTMDIDDAVVELLAKNYDILLISPTIIGESDDLATRILRAEREVRLRRIRMYARVVDWNIEYPLTRMLMVMR